MKLLPFQEEGVAFITSRKHTLLADDMGLGKSCQVIKAVESIKLQHVLIICPASVKLNWVREIKKWLKNYWLYDIQVINKRDEQLSHQANIIIVNYDLIAHSNIFNQLKGFDFDLLACDEAHYLKNMKATRTKAVLARNGLVHNARRTVMMTGTPVLNRPIELYPILKVLSPKTIEPYSDYYRFGRRFCDGYQDGFAFNADGASNTDDLNRRLRGGYMIRRMTHEVQVQLPPKRYQMIFVEQNAGAKAEFKEIENFSRKSVRHQNLGMDGGELATERKNLAMAKVQACAEYIKNAVESTQKLVIFAYHKNVISYLEKEFAEYEPATISGDSSQTARQSAIIRFKEQKNCKVFIGQIQAAGQGIDGLQHSCSNCIFLEWSWVPGEIEQAIKRLHRIGQENAVLIQFLVWADSIEEHMLRVALDKVEDIREILK